MRDDGSMDDITHDLRLVPPSLPGYAKRLMLRAANEIDDLHDLIVRLHDEVERLRGEIADMRRKRNE